MVGQTLKWGPDKLEMLEGVVRTIPRPIGGEWYKGRKGLSEFVLASHAARNNEMHPSEKAVDNFNRELGRHKPLNGKSEDDDVSDDDQDWIIAEPQYAKLSMAFGIYEKRQEFLGITIEQADKLLKTTTIPPIVNARRPNSEAAFLEDEENAATPAQVIRSLSTEHPGGEHVSDFATFDLSSTGSAPMALYLRMSLRTDIHERGEWRCEVGFGSILVDVKPLAPSYFRLEDRLAEGGEVELAGLRVNGWGAGNAPQFVISSAKEDELLKGNYALEKPLGTVTNVRPGEVLIGRMRFEKASLKPIVKGIDIPNNAESLVAPLVAKMLQRCLGSDNSLEHDERFIGLATQEIHITASHE